MSYMYIKAPKLLHRSSSSSSS